MALQLRIEPGEVGWLEPRRVTRRGLTAVASSAFALVGGNTERDADACASIASTGARYERCPLLLRVGALAAGIASGLLLSLLLCQEIERAGVWSGMGAGVWRRRQMRRVRWRLRQRMASLVLLPSARLRAM
jgi:hypothetical protein